MEERICRDTHGCINHCSWWHWWYLNLLSHTGQQQSGPARWPDKCFVIRWQQGLHHLIVVGVMLSITQENIREGFSCGLLTLTLIMYCFQLASFLLLELSLDSKEDYILTTTNTASSIIKSIFSALFTALAILKFFQCQFYRHID